jgi:hypothetical protein
MMDSYSLGGRALRRTNMARTPTNAAPAEMMSGINNSSAGIPAI